MIGKDYLGLVIPVLQEGQDRIIMKPILMSFMCPIMAEMNFLGYILVPLGDPFQFHFCSDNVGSHLCYCNSYGKNMKGCVCGNSHLEWDSSNMINFKALDSGFMFIPPSRKPRRKLCDSTPINILYTTLFLNLNLTTVSFSQQILCSERKAAVKYHKYWLCGITRHA